MQINKNNTAGKVMEASAVKRKKATKSSINFKNIQNTQFLNNMHNILPWENIISLIEEKYAASSLGRSMIRAETMVRIYFVQMWYQLSDAEIEETLFFCKIVRDFALLHQGIDLIPGKSEITQFRHLVEQQKLEALLVKQLLTISTTLKAIPFNSCTIKKLSHDKIRTN